MNIVIYIYILQTIDRYNININKLFFLFILFINYIILSITLALLFIAIINLKINGDVVA